MKLVRQLHWLNSKHKDSYSKIGKLGTWRMIQKICYACELMGSKDEAPLGSPFIGEPKCGQPAKVGGRAAGPCGQKLSNLSPRCGGWDKGEYSRRERREKRGKVADRPWIFGRVATLGLHSTPTFNLHHILLLSCSLHWPKTSKVKEILFIFF
jgi:hypothetical protein